MSRALCIATACALLWLVLAATHLALVQAETSRLLPTEDSDNERLTETAERELKDDGFKLFQDSKASLNFWYFDSGRYVVVRYKKYSWWKANQFCRHYYGTSLATVVDHRDWNALRRLWKKHLRYANCWIGCHEEGSGRYGDHDREGWYWTSGVPYNSHDAFWREDEPNGYPHEKCCFLWKWSRWHDGWDDARCFWKYYFICDSEHWSPNHVRRLSDTASEAEQQVSDNFELPTKEGEKVE